jgi:shikimate kinase
MINTTSQPADSRTVHTIVSLTGFMGSGKTSIGRALAKLLGWEFVDLDEEIERHERIPIRKLFRERGESAFRAIEHEALRNCLERCSGSTVVALGGGTFIQGKNAELLSVNDVRTVFLETPVEEMLRRCGVEDEADPQNPRPLAADTFAFRKLYEQRLSSYRVAELTIDTSGKVAEEVAGEIVERLQLTAKR